MSDGPKITPEAAEGLRALMKARREGKFPDSPYPVVVPHVARPPKDDAMQYSKRESPDHWWPEDAVYMGYDLAKSEDRTAAFLWSCEAAKYRAKRARRHAWYTAFAIILALCVIVGVCLVVGGGGWGGE